MIKFSKFKSNFKKNIGKYIENVDEESIAKIIKTYEELYENENFKNRSEIKNLAIHLATAIDIIYLYNTQKGGDNEIECVICLGENKQYEPPIDIVECPRKAINKHGCCKLCWLKLWVSKGFGKTNGIKCPLCTYRLQLNDDKFNNMPDNFKEFIQNRDNLDIDNKNIRDVIDTVELRDGHEYSSHLLPELKELISEPETRIDIRDINREEARNEERQEQRQEERKKMKEVLLMLSVIVAMQAYDSVSSSQSIFLRVPNPNIIHLFMIQQVRQQYEGPQENPAEALMWSLVIIVCFIFEIGIPRNFIEMLQTNRDGLRNILEGIVQQQLGAEFRQLQEGGKRKRKTKKGRKNKKNKSKKIKRSARKRK